MTIHASANKSTWAPVRSVPCASLTTASSSPPPSSLPGPDPNHGPVAGSYWNSISDPDLTPVSCAVRCLSALVVCAWPSQDSGVWDPPRPVSQSNIATRLLPTHEGPPLLRG